MAETASPIRRVAIAVRGVVQGVGFRPFIYNLARGTELSGWVRNEADTVRIEVQGPVPAVERFVEQVRLRPPAQAKIERLDVREVPCMEPAGSFEILQSPTQGAPRPTIPADLATCPECLEEIRTPGQRRYNYPFTNCTNCGPRWSILRQLPYDRPRTSMASFVLCDDCRREYLDPGDRRFHAQPVACPHCGPQLALLDAAGHALARGEAALDLAARAVVEGKILALKGLGGFQLVVDATSEPAVRRLRERKQRPNKPLALLATLDEVRRLCQVSDEEQRLLGSSAAPIVLLRRAVGGEIAPAVAPGNPYLGVMLPCTPLHWLLSDRWRRPVVCTSGNLSEEPMAVENDEALEKLAPIADVFLVHDRPIVRPVDDSVVQVVGGKRQTVRRARGYAPRPIAIADPGAPILAAGGHLKNTVALVIAGEAVLSPHIGDLDNVQAAEVHRRTIEDLVSFFQAAPAVVACDLHPDYASTRLAETLAARWQARLVRVQHHHAHVAAVMAEHRLDGPVLGLSWDGTGYGPDGTIWGGEMLLCDGAGFFRAARLRTFPLPGGDRAIRQPRRSALGLLFEHCGQRAAEIAAPWFRPEELAGLTTVLRRRQFAPRTSSIGRLFDAVAALCGMPGEISYEGQAAMALEYAAEASVTEAYPFPLNDAVPAVADWGPLVEALLEDIKAGVPRSLIAARFHNALANLAVTVVERFAVQCERRVALGGGCFHNAYLTAAVREKLTAAGFNTYINREVPPGDGGIALGQAWIAAQSEAIQRRSGFPA